MVCGVQGIAAQCRHSGAIGARRAPQAQVDAPGIECSQGAELLGDHQRCVVGQHDAAGTNANLAGTLGNKSQGDCCRRTGDAGHVVVLGHPEAVVAQLLRVLGQRPRIHQGLPGITAFGNRGQVENGIGAHRSSLLL